MRRFVLPVLLAVVGGLLLGAYPLTEALGYGDALPVLVGDVPGGDLDRAVFQAGALILARIGAIFVAPALLLAAVLDVALILVRTVFDPAFSRFVPGSSSRGAKGPTPEPVGSTGGGL